MRSESPSIVGAQSTTWNISRAGDYVRWKKEESRGGEKRTLVNIQSPWIAARDTSTRDECARLDAAIVHSRLLSTKGIVEATYLPRARGEERTRRARANGACVSFHFSCQSEFDQPTYGRGAPVVARKHDYGFIEYSLLLEGRCDSSYARVDVGCHSTEDAPTP